MNSAEPAIMIIERYQDIRAWQFAQELEQQVFAFTARPPASMDVDFCRQIRKSSSSARRNMAEGFGRFWPGEFAHKMRIAIGELEETQDQLDKARDVDYISEAEYEEMYRLADRSIGASVRLANYLETSGEDWKKGYRAAARKRRSGKKVPKNRESGT